MIVLTLSTQEMIVLTLSTLKFTFTLNISYHLKVLTKLSVECCCPGTMPSDSLYSALRGKRITYWKTSFILHLLLLLLILHSHFKFLIYYLLSVENSSKSHILYYDHLFFLTSLFYFILFLRWESHSGTPFQPDVSISKSSTNDVVSILQFKIFSFFLVK